MNFFRKELWGLALVSLLCIGSCKKQLIKVNQNPNGAALEEANPSLVLSYVLTQTAQLYIDLGFGDLMGVMQYTAKDGWGSSYNSYKWDGDNPWNNYYYTLRNNKYVYDRALEEGNELVEGISLIMRAELFGLLTDLYGTIPYENALKGDALKGGNENIFPPYTDQKTVYLGILGNLEEANTLLSKPASAYNKLVKDGDTYYGGDPSRWRKVANSLALRYYMRLSEKLPDVAKKGIEKIANNPSQYPIITSHSDDMISDFPYFSTTVASDPDSSQYRRVKLGASFGKLMVKLNDPRIGQWATKVQIFLNYLPNSTASKGYITDTVVHGEHKKVRYITPAELISGGLTTADINQDPDYVGIPVGTGAPQAYNLNATGTQAPRNPHVSWLNPVYTNIRSNPVENAKIITAAEVHFILAEAKAVKGWTNVDAEQQYYEGIKQSFETWDVSGYNNYITHPDIVYDPSKAQKQIIIQKYINNWSSAQEAWFDWRRTGYPDIHGASGIGAATLAPELPIRLYYPKDEQHLNAENMEVAAEQMEKTQYSSRGETGDDFNSPWTKMWVLQGTGKPW